MSHVIFHASFVLTTLCVKYVLMPTIINVNKFHKASFYLLKYGAKDFSPFHL